VAASTKPKNVKKLKIFVEILKIPSRLVFDLLKISFKLKVILKAMDEIDPPVKLDNPANEASKKYILEVASKPDFDYPQVSFSRICFIKDSDLL
jgi:hypothetical protein